VIGLETWDGIEGIRTVKDPLSAIREAEKILK
jgi:hypothetical protein